MRFVGTFILRASSAALSSSTSSSSAKCSPGWIAAIAITVLLVIIDNLHVGRPGRSGGPLKAQAPLIVYANAVLALPVAKQRLKSIAGQRSQVSERCGRLQTIQLHPRGAFKPREGFDEFPRGEVPRSLITVTGDHHKRIACVTRYVKHNVCHPRVPEAGGQGTVSGLNHNSARPANSHRHCRFRNACASPLFPFWEFPLITEFLVKMIAFSARQDRNDS